MEIKKNTFYEIKDYGRNEDYYKYIRVDDIVGDTVYATKFTENWVDVGKTWSTLWDVRAYKETPKTLQTLCVGDILIDEAGHFKKVLGVVNQNFYFISGGVYSLPSTISENCVVGYTTTELKSCGWKPYTGSIEQEEKATEMTVKEISDELGYEVKIIKE